MKEIETVNDEKGSHESTEGLAYAMTMQKISIHMVLKAWPIHWKNNKELTTIRAEIHWICVSTKIFIMDETLIPSVMGFRRFFII